MSAQTAQDGATAVGAPGELQALLARLSAEQQDLSAAAAFARSSERGEVPNDAGRYARLMPATAPREGEQYAFEVDLDRCSGCKACVAACHALNGLDEGEAWRDVGLLVGGSTALPVLQHVTTSCHHCLSPSCLAACPVDAYEKDPATGIVKHLDDQCIGCQYCVFACPYEAPKYHAGKGIVRKCDMCSARLAAAEPPACAQACPTEAIRIRLVDVREALEDAEAANFLPAAPDPRIAYPTTTYKTRRVFPRNMLPVDYFQVGPQQPHWPLVVMLVLTQLSVGAFAIGVAMERLPGGAPLGEVGAAQTALALAFGLLALAASVLHLGRPQYAYRAVLGVRHSWLSREIAAFGLFAALAFCYALVRVVPAVEASPAVERGLGAAAAAAGAAAVFCSVMIYASVRRELWSFSRTAVRFALSSLLLGLAALASILSLRPALAGASPAPALDALAPPLCSALVAVGGAKLLWEAALFIHLTSRSTTPLRRSALLMVRDLAAPSLARFALGLLGCVVAPLLLRSLAADARGAGGLEPTLAALATFGATLGGELLERCLFFAAVAAPRMPGGIR